MVLFYTDLHEEKISASNMREAAIKSILMAYYQDLKHSPKYEKLAKQIRRDDSLDRVLAADEWSGYEFETPQLKTHVTVYGKRKNACFEISRFERTSLKDVVVYIINRRRLVIPLKDLEVKIVSGHKWQGRRSIVQPSDDESQPIKVEDKQPQ